MEKGDNKVIADVLGWKDVWFYILLMTVKFITLKDLLHLFVEQTGLQTLCSS